MDNIPDGLAHRPVLYQEILQALRPTPGGYYVDGTLGAGGHAWGILQASSPDGKLLGMDVDPQALVFARERLKAFGNRVVIVQASYIFLADQLAELNWPEVNGILLDLGLSSIQLNTVERGFSFNSDGPLDMRFNPLNPVSAEDFVNELPEGDLANLIARYGEEPAARRIAKAIVNARPVNTTADLAKLIMQIVNVGRVFEGRSSSRKKLPHPATRTFQALRIAVNDELRSVENILPIAVNSLTLGGRLAVVSFHSLEDRLVKQYFRKESKDCFCPPRQPVCTCGHRAILIEITRRPIKPSSGEIMTNPRSRSARLRIAERVL